MMHMYSYAMSDSAGWILLFIMMHGCVLSRWNVEYVPGKIETVLYRYHLAMDENKEDIFMCDVKRMTKKRFLNVLH